jgi:DNA-binding NarL/FixJ family response regulator
MKRVFIIDDHSAIREGFKVILERSGRYSAMGGVGSAEEALEVLARDGEQPDLFIVDISLPGASGLELAASLRRNLPASQIVVASMHREYDYIAGAFRAGALAYVSKDAGMECVVAALDAASNGSYYLDPLSLKLFVQEACLPSSKSPAARSGLSGLSEREIEVLRLLAAGKRAEEIAQELEVSQKTIENHLSNITNKLGAKDRFELYRLAARLEKI